MNDGEGDVDENASPWSSLYKLRERMEESHTSISSCEKSNSESPETRKFARADLVSWQYVRHIRGGRRRTRRSSSSLEMLQCSSMVISRSTILFVLNFALK